MNRNWALSADEIVSLPVDELALAVLRSFVESEEWSAYNWMNSAQSQEGLRARTGVIEALSAAWGWLYSRGLVARNYRQSSSDAVLVTALGHQALSAGLGDVHAADLLQVALHPRLEQKVRRQFLMREYELAALAAMREVEIRVRELAGAPQGSIGRDLMQQALKPGRGPLSDPALVKSEQESWMFLFSGAIGLFKNPPSHRQIDYDDPTEAAEVVLLADLLMRMLDSVQQRMSTNST